MKKHRLILAVAACLLAIGVQSQGIIVQPGAYLTVTSGAYVTTSGTAGLTVKSDASGTGSVVDYNATGGLTIAGSNKIERYLSSGQWHYFCPPVSNSISYPLLRIWVKYYIEPSHEWKYVIAADTALPVRGYATWANTDTTSVFTGILNTGTVSYPLTSTLKTVTQYDGWNFVGNPYTSAVDWNSVTGWTKTNIDNAIYYWNDGNYSYFVGTSGTAPFTGGTSVNNGSQFIPAMQGFMVHVTVGSTTGTLAVNNAARLHSGTAYYKEAPDEPVVRLVATYQDKTDELLVRAIGEATSEFDKDFDAYKLLAGNRPQIYTLTPDTTKLAINTVPEITRTLQIPVGFKFSDPGNYSISASEIQIGEGMVVYLDDLKENKSQNLLNLPDYSFTAVTGDDPDRFVLRFKETPIAIDDQEMQNSFQVYASGSALVVKKLTAQNAAGTIELYDMIGRRVFSSVLEDLIVNRYELSVTEGYYVARLCNDNRVMTQKIFIH
jgi:hypothetical protein